MSHFVKFYTKQLDTNIMINTTTIERKIIYMIFVENIVFVITFTSV
jgi:hypothetical protein